jgi:hypothetical protein
MLRVHDTLLLKLAVPLRVAHSGPDPATVVKPVRRITRKRG